MIFLHHRCAGKADVTGLGERLAHAGVHGAVLGAMAFIYQHKDIRIIIPYGLTPNRGIKFVNHGGDDALLILAQHFRQVFAGASLFHLFSTGLERFVDLIVQIDPVCDQHNFVIRDIGPQRNGFCQEDHGEGLTAALGMPDHAAGPPAYRIALIDPAHDLFDAEVLLVAGNLLFAGIKEGKAIRQFKQPFWPTKRVNGSILRGDSAR